MSFDLSGLGYLSARDRVLFAQFPLLMAPMSGELPPCPPGARRLIAASDGLWVETVTPAVHFRGRAAPVVLPFGPVRGFCRLTGGLIPASIRDAVFERAKSCREEIACLVAWSRREAAYRLIWPDVDSVSRSHVTYSAWADTDDLSLAVDIHSHGAGAAFFSSTDDASDRGVFEPHLSVVLGRCDQPELQLATRFCVGQYLVDLPSAPFEAT